MKIQGSFQIAEPCHENWEKMTPEAQGRFCASCQRCVIDFTQKTATEMKTIYEREGGNVCGRVRVSQVVTERPSIRKTIQRWGQRSLKAVQVFGVALFLAFSTFFQAQAQTPEPKPVIMGKIAYHPQVEASTALYGNVVDENGNSVAGAELTFFQKDTQTATTTTDEDGRYRVELPNASPVTVTASKGNRYHYAPSVAVINRRPSRYDFAMEELVIKGQMLYIPEVDVEDTPDEILLAPSLEMAPTEEKAASVEEVELAGFKVKVYPNPSPDRVTFEVAHAGEGPLIVQLIDTQGKVVFERTWEQSMDPVHTLDLSDLATGTYHLVLQSRSEKISRQVIKI